MLLMGLRREFLLLFALAVIHERRLTFYFNRRRTRQSGPLGELFDHGVDALNTSLEVLLFSAAMNFGQGWKTVLVLFACQYPPETSHLQHH